MRMRITEPEIDKENPFLHDKLNREQSAIVLTQLFSNTEGPFVVSLNAPWGTGKTTFIKMFRQYLLNQGFPVIYFNAWETDYQDNPLIAFIGEINSGIEELKKQGFEIEKARKVFKKIKKTGKDILKKSIPVAIKTATHKALDIEKGGEDAFSDFISGVLENQIKNYSATKDQVQKFKEQLKELADELQKNEKSQNFKSKPLIFFIDELDRCRPDHAIQVLEKIKHFLDVDGIILVLGIDMEQLGYSVKTVFGQNMKERSYLRKFIDLEYNIPADNYISGLYCRYLSTETAITGILGKQTNQEDLLAELQYSSILMASTFSLSLSDLNVLFNSLYLILLTYENIQIETIALSVILISLKMRHVKLFNQVVNKERTVFYVINELNKIKKENNTIKEYDKFFIERRLISLNLKKVSDEEYQHQLNLSSIAHQNELNNIYKIIKDKNRLQSIELFTETFIKKIKFLDSFKFTEEEKK
ncbi:MAG TPA: P-loop NTPase fold protein [Spirochaetota bacterium]|nr:P-loop NTPase fold protein [Spirochaetota bacterium]